MKKQAKVSLVNWTPKPIETMCWSRRVMHSPVPDSVNDIDFDSHKWLGMSVDDYFNKILLHDGMPTFLEYVNFTFKLENVSRALQQQLTRHRIGFSYSIQSLRCIDLPNFADDCAYFNPYEDGSDANIDYHNSMLEVQESYRKALKSGVATQDARGLLPMNLYSTVTFHCSLRSLIGMISKRMCLKTQGEFRTVADQIVSAIINKVDSRLATYFKPPCARGKCMMEAENNEQYEKGLLEGKQNTDHICPIYLKKFVKKGDSE